MTFGTLHNMLSVTNCKQYRKIFQLGLWFEIRLGMLADRITRGCRDVHTFGINASFTTTLLFKNNVDLSTVPFSNLINNLPNSVRNVKNDAIKKISEQQGNPDYARFFSQLRSFPGRMSCSCSLT